MNLHGKTALVTGSTSGIGLGIAKVLAQAGAQLVLNGFGDSSHARAEVAALGQDPRLSRRRPTRRRADRSDDALCRKHLRRRRYRDQ
ncbi:D-beta-hydroxybutyrate dehydrogenase [Klebsiella pneumoniae]|uniref:D-beta-hydroxybutyrate dehydrogenase n=1 Tax=Klebsiella pneumoniae TaxID=573 RepID=A0A3S4KN42_KLEPN|nr:D-beta-hydroxybutyrate dehydrogenase [Klebsiella pneumoniae]